MKRALLIGLILAGLALVPALGQSRTPQGVQVLNFTRSQPIAQDVEIPAGQSAQFPINAENYARVSLLIAGTATPGTGTVAVSTLYGPPIVPSGPPRPLSLDTNGSIAARLLEPVLGPVMVVVIHNGSTAKVTLTLSAYLAN